MDHDALDLVGVVENEAGDTVTVGLQDAKVYLEVTSANREPVEVWLAPADAAGLGELLRRAVGA